MPQPTENQGAAPGGGRKPMDRAEAARHAALVRWGKKQPLGEPNAQRIANRVRELLAKKKKAKGGKGKGKAPKDSRTKQEIANQNRAAVAKQTGMAELEGTLVRLASGMQGAGMEKENHDKLIAAGLAERHADGTVTLSPAGKKWKSAADKGDAEAAQGALGDAKGKQADRGAKETAALAKRMQTGVQRELAKRAKEKEKAKASGGGGSGKKKEVEKPADKEIGESATDAKQEKQGENRAKVASDMAESDTGLSPSGSAALTAFADGAQLPKELAGQLTSMGLLEQDSAGGQRLSYAGRATVNAMNRGDTRAALDAISRGADRTKAKADTEQRKGDAEKERTVRATEREKERAKRDKERADRTAKEDASRARVEAARIEAARARNRKAIDMSDIELEDPAIKAGARHSRSDIAHLQAIHDSSVACGASCGPESDDSEDGDHDFDEDAEKAIKSIQDNPQWYASHECGDVSQACTALTTLSMLIQSELSEQDEDDAQIGMLCDAARILVRFIGGELDELQGAAGELPNSARVQTMKGIELAHLDTGEDVAVMGGAAVKALNGGGMVGGYLVKFGGDGDLSQYRDVFTKVTNFGKHTKSDVWVHHRMLPGLGKKQLTNQAELGMDDEGVFVKHLLDLRDTYEAKLYGMVQAGKLGWSSGTAPHLVERKALGDGRHEITQWTLGLDASYTPMPAGGFVVNAGAMKSLLDEAGIDLLNALYEEQEPDAIKAIEFELIAIEAEYAATASMAE